MTVRGPQNQNLFSLFAQGQVPGFPTPQRFGGQSSGTGSNPFQRATLSNPGSGLDQFGLFKSDLGSAINPNLVAPPIPPEGMGGRFLAMG